jgi:hypothetical protein
VATSTFYKPGRRVVQCSSGFAAELNRFCTACRFVFGASVALRRPQRNLWPTRLVSHAVGCAFVLFTTAARSDEIARGRGLATGDDVARHSTNSFEPPAPTRTPWRELRILQESSRTPGRVKPGGQSRSAGRLHRPTDTITRLRTLMLWRFQRLNKRLIEERIRSSPSNCASDPS